MDLKNNLVINEKLNNSIPYSLLGFVTVIWALTFYKQFIGIIHLYNASDTYSYGYAVYPIVAYLIWQKRNLLARQPFRANVWVAIPLLLTLFLWVLGEAANVQLFTQAATVIMLPLVWWLITGNQVAKLIWFPLAFSLFAIPFGEEAVPMLQNITAHVTVWFIKLVGIPVELSGLYINLPNAAFEVAKACSGIRYLTVTIFTCSLFCYFYFERWYKWVAFILLAIFISILANSLRAFGIIMIAHFIDIKYAQGVDHLIYGWLFFGVIIAIIFFIGNFWVDKGKITKDSNSAISDGNHRLVQANSKIKYAYFTPISIIVLLYLIAFSFTTLLSFSNVPLNSKINGSLLSQYFVKLPPNLIIHPKFVNPNDVYVGRALGNTGIDIYIAKYSDYYRGRQMLGSANKIYDNSKLSLEKSYDQKLKINGKKYEFKVLNLISTQKQRKKIAYWYQLQNRMEVNDVQIKISQAISRLMGHRNQGAFIAISIPNKKSSQIELNNFIKKHYQVIKQAALSSP